MKKEGLLKDTVICEKSNIVRGEHYRLTMLTSQMVRLEYSYNGVFEDRPTQTVINREFPSVDYKVRDKENSLEIETDNIHLIYNKEEFSENGLCIKVKGKISAYHSVWYYGSQINDLKGTARTLDKCDGETQLENGLLSRNGFSLIDDSKSFVINKNGKLKERKNQGLDLYFFGYGREYQKCLKDYFKLTGATPLLPRYALGNWWSRYYRYTQEEYQGLMEKFEEKRIPISVAVIDMDWHLVDIDEKYGSGWTGYTWNKELFPDYKAFLLWLHKHNLRVTLNVHPAEGVKGHEEMYLEMAKELGCDYENEVPIQFDITQEKFAKCYFKYLHHPQEESGVDFWWIDWQQGGHSKIPGLDPLWLLNYMHYLDNERNGKRGLILSRYAGPGSHRYPIGFSGDTVMTWDSLAFQPYFTATASNIGYCWWSHDIGGHMRGIRNEELAIRWMQFGVFSPIMRLHSSSSPFNSKEPWAYSKSAEYIMTFYLQLRSRLVPYLYTMNHRCHVEGEPLIQPMYYQYAQQEDAYKVKNQYFFGTQVIVSPITSPIYSRLGLGKTVTWLPEGIYIDSMTGLIYKGNRYITMYRSLNQLPVLAKAGSIVPLIKAGQESNEAENPKYFDIYVCAGSDGHFTLYEDDGLSMEYKNGKSVTTDFDFFFEKGEFIIGKPKGAVELVPEVREYTIHLFGLLRCNEVKIFLDGNEVPVKLSYQEEENRYIIEDIMVPTTAECKIVIYEKMELANNNIVNIIYMLLSNVQIELETKEKVYEVVKRDSSPYALSELMALNLEKELIEAVSEILLAYI